MFKASVGLTAEELDLIIRALNVQSESKATSEEKREFILNLSQMLCGELDTNLRINGKYIQRAEMGASLQVCDRPECLDSQAKNWNSIANTQGTPRPTREGFCSWCWSEIKVSA